MEKDTDNGGIRENNEEKNMSAPETMREEQTVSGQRQSRGTTSRRGRHFKEDEKPSVLRQIWWFLRPTVICCAVVLFLMFFVFLYAVVPSGSMENTIMTDSFILANRRAYDFSEPMRGDVIVFETDQAESKMLVKRIIATEGEHVELIDGSVYINGTLLNEPYVQGKTWSNTAGSEFWVPEGCVFVMGDNREYSADARGWQDPYLPVGNIKGRVFVNFSIKDFYFHIIDKGANMREIYGEIPVWSASPAA